MTLKIRYSVVSVNNYGNTTNTVITGSYAEKLADAHYNELVLDKNTKYVVELVFKDDDKQGNVRAEFFAKNGPVVEEQIFPRKPRTREEYAIHMSTRQGDSRDNGGFFTAHVWRDIDGHERILDNATACLNDIVNYENELMKKSPKNYEDFWAVTGRDYDRWGRKVPATTGPASSE